MQKEYTQNYGRYPKERVPDGAAGPQEPPMEMEYPLVHSMFNFLGPIGPPCRSSKLQSFGWGGDESRACVINGINEGFSAGGCVVISIVSNSVSKTKKWGFSNFELDIYKNTQECYLHIFDCTADEPYSIPAQISNRTTFHRVCLGVDDAIIEGKQFFSWPTLLVVANVSKAPALVRMDIEGREFESLRSIIESSSGHPIPLQISLTLYLTSAEGGRFRIRNAGEVTTFMSYLREFGGYSLIDRQDDKFSPYRSTILLVRTKCRNITPFDIKQSSLLGHLQPVLSEALTSTFPTSVGVSQPTTISETEHRIRLLREGCGEVCDTSIQGKQSLFFPEIRKQVNCTGIWSNSHIDDGRPPGPPPSIPDDMKFYYQYGGRVNIYEWHNYNNMYLGTTAMVSVWEHTKVEEMKKNCSDGTLEGNYGVYETIKLKAGLDHMGDRIRGGRVLVIGSENPWVEACVLAAGAASVVTLEYGSIDSKHPQISSFTPDKMRQQYLSNQLPFFDAIVTFSSVEHSGLGRYGDALNPWGDLQTLARAWCVAKPGAALVLAVMGTGSARPDDSIHFNAHRVYGTVMYSHLLANWKQVWRHKGGSQRVYALSKLPPVVGEEAGGHTSASL